MKVVLIFILGLFFIPEKKDVVLYSHDKKLTWADFKVVNNLTDATAETSTKISYYFEKSNGNITIKVYCIFDKENSFVVKGKQTAYMLNHEQRHFDLTHIYANILYERFLKKNNLTEDDAKHIYEKTIDEWQTIQDRYDLETDHSIDTIKQLMWDKETDNMKLTLWKKR